MQQQQLLNVLTLGSRSTEGKSGSSELSILFSNILRAISIIEVIGLLQIFRFWDVMTKKVSDVFVVDFGSIDDSGSMNELGCMFRPLKKLPDPACPQTFVLPVNQGPADQLGSKMKAENFSLLRASTEWYLQSSRKA